MNHISNLMGANVLHVKMQHIKEVKIDDVYGKRVREGYTFTYTQPETFSG